MLMQGIHVFILVGIFRWFEEFIPHIFGGTMLFSFLVFHEKLSRKALVGLCLMMAATLAMAVFG